MKIDSLKVIINFDMVSQWINHDLTDLWKKKSKLNGKQNWHGNAFNACALPLAVIFLFFFYYKKQQQRTYEANARQS